MKKILLLFTILISFSSISQNASYFRSGIRIGEQTTPSNPRDGQIWFDGTNIFLYESTTMLWTQITNPLVAVLEVTESGNTGVRLESTDPSLVQDIGNNAVDLGRYTGGTAGASGENSGILAGLNNRASALNTVILGGQSNIAFQNNTAVLGGLSNSVVGGFHGVIAGGQSNNISVFDGFIGGGNNNDLVGGLRSAIIGGQDNMTNGNNSVVVGGFTNMPSGNNAVTLGGENLKSESYCQTVLGMNNILVTPMSASTFDPDDAILTVGNGSNSTNRSDAFTIYKNGVVQLHAIPLSSITTPVEGGIIIDSEESNKIKIYLNGGWQEFTTVAD